MRRLGLVRSLLLLAALFTVFSCGDDDSDSGPKKEDGGHSTAGSSPPAVESDAHTPPPPPECKSDDDCDDGRFCNGGETCGSDGQCKAGELVACDDGIACTEDLCVETTRSCRSIPPDAGGDGVFDIGCKDADGEPFGLDCDDHDALRFPGNIEICDEANHDEDCDPHTNGEKDSDGDGF